MASHSVSLNEDICQIFERLRDIRKEEGEEWRVHAYNKVIPFLRTHPKRLESGDEARQIPGVGARMAARIDEILQTGTLDELSRVPILTEEDQEKRTTIDLFESVHRVGRKTAEKWYSRGYRSLKDVPLGECTGAQQLAIQFHSELEQRIPRDEIIECEQILTQYLGQLNIQFQICGSYRRGRPDSGDIDILVLAQKLAYGEYKEYEEYNEYGEYKEYKEYGEYRNVLAEVLTCPIFTHTLACGPKKFLGIGKIRELHRRIDIEVVLPEEYPFAVVYFTGPGSFNVKMREYCAQHGYRLNEKSLTDKNGVSYPAQNEAHVFQMLGLKYLTPEERDNY